MAEPPYWKTTPLAAMTDAQWEALCDGCGRCCLHKLRDEDDDILYTEVSCRLLDTHTCGCSDYLNRQAKVPDCVRLTPQELEVIDWLPQTCGYRRIAEGRDLAWWHPLVSGSPETVHEAGISVRGRTVDERNAGMLEDHIVAWPARTPKGAGLRAPTARRRAAAK